MLKAKTKAKIATAGVLSIAAGVQASTLITNQTEAVSCSIASGNTSCDTSATFQVDVVESLTVTVTTPSSSASGSMNTFLRNKVSLTVASNNANGFYASIYAPNSAGLNLTNSTSGNSETIAPVTANTTRGNFATSQINHWGYSLDDIDAGSTSSNYSAISTTPTRVLYNSGAASETKDIYFGTQTDATKASGTYTGTVVVGVVSGSIGTTPVAPSDPAQNNDTTSGWATYDLYHGGHDRTVYYSESGNSTTATVSAGNTAGSYASPAGVIEHTSSSIPDGNLLATGLIVASAATAASGLFFIILAKRKKDDDEEDDEENMV